MKLIITLLVLLAFVLLAAFVLVPFVAGRLESGAPLFGATPAAEAAEQTAPPVNPILTNQVETVQFGAGYGLPTAVVDPSVWQGEILFATGQAGTPATGWCASTPKTGAFTNIEITRINDTLRYPVENADRILYADCKSGGGGSIVQLDKATGKTAVLSEFCAGSAEARAGGALRRWTERTDAATAKLIVCDVTSGSY
jgi:hypothetical protein